MVLAPWLLTGNVWADGAAVWEVKNFDGTDYLGVEAVAQFYHLDHFSREGARITVGSNKVGMTLEIGSAACTINGVKFIFAKPVIEKDLIAYVSREDLAGLLEPVFRPNSIGNSADFQTVILDAAFGGNNKGGSNEFGTAADFTLKIARQVKTQLEDKGFHVAMTRDGDRDLTLEERRDVANGIAGSAVFVSISLNSGAKEISGISTIPLSSAAVGKEEAGAGFGAASVALSTSIHGSAVRRLGRNTTDAGIQRDGNSVLSGVKHPALQINAGYMTHPYEAKLINNGAYQNAIASGIVDGILRYRYAIAKKPPVAEAE